MLKKVLFFLNAFLFFVSNNGYIYARYNINLIGFLNDVKSVSRHTTSFIDCLPSEVEQIKLFQTKEGSFKDLTDIQKNILKRGVSLKDKPLLANLIGAGLQISGISICTEHLWHSSSWRAYKSIPDKSIIRYHYCVTERTKISKGWSDRFNRNFDALIVADEWLVDVYKNSGVKIPIFTLPLAIDLNSLLARPLKKSAHKPFTFGVSATYPLRKNLQLLIRAFHLEFSNNPNVQLLVHGRSGSYNFDQVKRLAKSLRTKNIKILIKNFSRKGYEDFIAGLDCLALVSKGEGYSITPREALAASVPCILSNNTAHKTICKSTFVYAVPSNKIEKSFCGITGQYLGNEFNCDISDVRKALRHVYSNYSEHLAKAHAGRKWAKQYLPKNLQPLYLNVVRPSNVVLGPKNEITAHYLMTNSKELFQKYVQLCKSEKTKFRTL